MNFLIEVLTLTITLYVFFGILPYLFGILFTVIDWILIFARAVIDSILTFIDRRRKDNENNNTRK